MRRSLFVLSLLATFLPLFASDAEFVLVPGGELRPSIRVDDFEMSVHPVTNAQYAAFIRATGYAPPPYWEDGRIPAGLENHPVVFVSRYHDVRAYTDWRTSSEGRIHRLPTASEFEYAARAGRPDVIYPWGNEDPAGRANFSPHLDPGEVPRWQQRLQPVKHYAPNPWGLYDLAGNVWQMVDEYPDVTLGGFIFRITSPDDREGWAMGGSWLRGEMFLRIGESSYQLEGIRKPDLGFRIVRAPQGTTHFQRQTRRVVAAPAGEGGIFVSWQLLPSDPTDVGFHVYRTQYRHAAGERVTVEPVRKSTNFVDEAPPGPKPTVYRGGPNAPQGERMVYYRVRPVSPDGGKGAPSEWAGTKPAPKRSGLIAKFEPNVRQGGFLPIFGDLDGDGATDVVFRLDNGVTERSPDLGLPVEIEAFTSYGKSIWRRPLVWHAHCFGNHNNAPVVLYDLDGDDRDEVIARVQVNAEVFLAVINGRNGEILRQTPWPALVSDLSRSSTRINLAIAYLDGVHPAIITQSGLYENEIFTAFDGELNQLWQFKSFGETNGSGGHYIEVADVDGDGRDEVFNGTTCLNSDGTVRWSIYAGHPDIVKVKHIIPGRPGRQVFFAVEDNTNAGAYVVDADTGAIIWKVNREDDERWVHAHTGWVADIWAATPGLEMMTNRDGHEARDTVLFAADGRTLLSPFPRGWGPVNWTGGDVRDLMSGDGRRLGRFTGLEVEELPIEPPNEGEGRFVMAADLAGDFRDEIVFFTRGGKDETGAVFIYTNTAPIQRRDVARLTNREYRLWLARNLGGGYRSFFEWQR